MSKRQWEVFRGRGCGRGKNSPKVRAVRAKALLCLYSCGMNRLDIALVFGFKNPNVVSVQLDRAKKLVQLNG